MRGKNSPADLFVSVDAGKLQKGAELGLFQKVSNSVIENNVSKDLQDKNGYWIPYNLQGQSPSLQ